MRFIVRLLAALMIAVMTPAFAQDRAARLESAGARHGDPAMVDKKPAAAIRSTPDIRASYGLRLFDGRLELFLSNGRQPDVTAPPWRPRER